jgi:hypothetical protein
LTGQRLPPYTPLLPDQYINLPEEFFMKYLKRLIVWGCVAGLGYLLLSYHFIFVGSSPKLLKKPGPSMDYIFFSTQGKTNHSILSVDVLRKAGIGQVLVQTGKISEDELDRLTERIEDERESGK